MLGLALAPLLLAAGPAAPDVEEAVERGRGWYVAGASIPEPPIALALVIVGVAGMRARERRRRRAAG